MKLFFTFIHINKSKHATTAFSAFKKAEAPLCLLWVSVILRAHLKIYLTFGADLYTGLQTILNNLNIKLEEAKWGQSQVSRSLMLLNSVQI